MISEFDVLKDVSRKLETSGINFMLSGSFAMGYYARPRMTRDIDIIIEVNSAMSKILYELFCNEYYVSKDAIDEAIKHQFMFNIIHNEAVVKVDFIICKNTPYRKVEFERRKKITFNDFSTYIVSIEDLIISKLIWMKDSDSEL